jgi:predicted metal-dependent phosphotriesterase family hydrolase
MVPYTVEELRRRGAKEGDLKKLVWDNPWTFFSKSGRLK